MNSVDLSSSWCSLDNLALGLKAVVRELRMTGSMLHRLVDLGLVENTEIQCVGRAPGGDPSAYLICGAVIAIRAKDSRSILVSPITGAEVEE